MMKSQFKVLSRGVITCSLLYVVVSHTAFAACNVTMTSGLPQVIQMDMGRIVIPATTAIGAVFATRDFPITGINGYGSCTASGGSAIGIMEQGSDTGGRIYSSLVPGVGIRLSRVAGSLGQLNYPHVLTLTGASTLNLNAGLFRVELIKTAATTGSGAFAAGEYTSYYLNGTGPSRPMLTSVLSGNGITIVSPSCMVDAGSLNIPVDFGSVPKSTFTGVGSTAAERNFAINLTCQQSPGNVLISLDPNTGGSTSSPGVLAIATGAGAATGVGIQLLDARNDQPVTYGVGIPAGNRISSAGPLSVPFKARYYQTQTTVTPGTANSTATFTIQYN